jgi:hypothetical protein
MLEELAKAIAQERGCKRPRAKLLRALESKARELRTRKAVLDEVRAGEFFGTVSPHDALSYAGAADTRMMLVAGPRAEYIDHGPLLHWLASLTATTKVRVYSCGGTCYFGLAEFPAGVYGSDPAIAARGERPEVEAFSPRANFAGVAA